MHFLMFRFKRAHQRSLALARRFADELKEITPARFDIMRVLSGFGTSQMHQCELWKALGISRAAGSNMVRRLMALGLLTRWPSEADRRTFVVAFTTEGAEAMRRALLFLHRYKPFEIMFGRAFGDVAAQTLVVVKKLDSDVDRVARCLRDTSWNLYPNKTAEDIERAVGTALLTYV